MERLLDRVPGAAGDADRRAIFLRRRRRARMHPARSAQLLRGAKSQMTQDYGGAS